MQVFEYQGLKVHYRRQGQGRPVVFLHNGGTSHAIWEPVLARLGAGIEAFALDLPGFGASDSPVASWGLADYTDLLEAFIEAHGLAPAGLVGNCMGSAMALALARRRPDCVAGLVLVNPLTTATFAGGWLGPALWLRQRAPTLSRRLRRGLDGLALPAPLARQAVAFQLGRVGRRLGLQREPALAACYARDAQARALLAVLEDVPNYAELDALAAGALRVSVCTVWGLQNRVLSAAAGRRLNARLRPAREEWLEGCGHLAMLEKPEAVARVVREFLADRDGRGPAEPESGAPAFSQ